MAITISLTELLLAMLILAGIILLIYLIVMVAKLLPSLKSLSKILSDVETMSGVAKDATVDAKGAFKKLSGSVVDLSEMLKGNKSIVSAGSSIVNAAAAVKGLVKKSSDSEKKDEKK